MLARRVWLGCAAGLSLSACGFALRQTGTLPFASLYANFGTAGGLGAELMRQLQALPNLEVLTRPDTLPRAQVVLDIVQEQRQQVVVGVNAQGQVRELQLRMTVTFRLRTPEGVEWIEPAELYQQRDLSFNETAALSKEIETALLFRDMQNDIAQQMIRGLSRVKPPTVR